MCRFWGFFPPPSSCCGNVGKEVLLGSWYNVKKKIIAYPLSPFLFRSCLTKPPVKHSKMAIMLLLEGSLHRNCSAQFLLLFYQLGRLLSGMRA